MLYKYFIYFCRNDFPKLDPEEARRPFNYDDGKPHLIIQRSSPHSKSGTPRRDCQGNFVSHRTDPCSVLDPHARLLLGSHSFLDIFVLADNGSTLFDEYERITYARDVILPVMPCKFLGMSTNCPNKVPEYLATNYGKDFMKPYKVCRHGSWDGETSTELYIYIWSENSSEASFVLTAQTKTIERDWN
jgi:hypothetical protein